MDDFIPKSILAKKSDILSELEGVGGCSFSFFRDFGFGLADDGFDSFLDGLVSGMGIRGDFSVGVIELSPFDIGIFNIRPKKYIKIRVDFDFDPYNMDHIIVQWERKSKSARKKII